MAIVYNSILCCLNDLAVPSALLLDSTRYVY